uniref:Peptidase C14 caspase domain-containing protein n=1 Tax=viral metagenome TaxID=1070528 RepID=A0A6C0J6T5_9ZZZZ
MSFLGTSNTKLALVIGINYTGKNGELRGCINDTQKIINTLKTRCGYKDSQIILLTDDTEKKPTKNNMLNAIDEFVDRSHKESCKELWFSYSGHGSYTINNGDDNEQDNKDEALVPLDYETAGLITDDVLNSKLVKRLPKDAKLFALIDACHSGTSLDLPYIYRIANGLECHGNEQDILDVCKISGCRDNQTSADAFINKNFQGALTFTFIKTLDDFRYNMTPKQIIEKMKNFLKQNGYSQIPTLALSKKHILDEMLMGEDKSFNPNINIYLEGDTWCKDETSWNLFDLQKNKLLFNENRRFFMENEKINYKFDLDNGTYLLIFNDTYGDGGVQGNIKYLKSGKILNNFIFNSGSRRAIEFKVNKMFDLDTSLCKKEINLEIKCDYYGSQESRWNISDKLGRNVFETDKIFKSPNEIQKINEKLAPGEYHIKLRDVYGDGGIIGTIFQNSKIILDFRWTNLDWTTENGYNKSYSFIVL